MSDRVQATALVEAVIKRINAGYIFPERSARAASLLRARCEAGAYDLPAGPELCERLSADLLEACADKHLRLLWHESVEASRDDAGLVAALLEQFRRENYGIRRVEQLPGNIGLIELTIIPPASDAGPAIAAAMRLIEHTDALILDLRAARGGAPDGVAFLCSFFFPDGDVHIDDIIEGPDGPARQFWTHSYLPGPRYLERPIYALTSAITFSGGEALAYDLQVLGRAIIVGEITRGGAHPSEVVSLGEHVELRLPVARPVNPVTGTNWEGVGVQPDVATLATTALTVAHRAALESLAGNETLPVASRAEARRLLDQLAS